MSIEILEAGSDREQWRAMVSALPGLLSDIYYHPEYLELHRFDAGAVSQMFVYGSGEARWLYPFLLRPVPGAEGRYDIESQYGYGGPLATCEDESFLDEANAAFALWCRERGVVAEFVRFHPLLQNQRFVRQMQLLYDRDTVSLSLAALKGGELPFDQKTSNMLRRAERSGLTCRIGSSGEAFDTFVELYRATMGRLQADQYYYFSDRYFAGLKALMQSDGFMVQAEYEGATVAAGVFLKGKRALHYHLSASDAASRVPGSTNFMLYQAALHGEGLDLLHLGGGRTSSPDDSLLKFKAKMATQRHPFYIGKKVHDAELYAELRRRWESEHPGLVPRYGVQLLCYHNV